MTKAKRPRDTNHLAKFVVDIATGEVDDELEKNSAQRKGGKLGGAKRAQNLSAKKRSDIARAAAAARWKKRS